MRVVQHDKVNDVDHLNLTMGKMDHKDNEDVRQTLFRELDEETNEKITDDLVYGRLKSWSKYKVEQKPATHD